MPVPIVDYKTTGDYQSGFEPFATSVQYRLNGSTEDDRQVRSYYTWYSRTPLRPCSAISVGGGAATTKRNLTLNLAALERISIFASAVVIIDLFLWLSAVDKPEFGIHLTPKGMDISIRCKCEEFIRGHT